MSTGFFDRRDAVVWMILIWKSLLFACFCLPVPSNDSFFYDGPVVNLLLHGKYANPSIALALPISGTEVFSAYPPVYQGVLLAWMSACGSSAYAAMALHLLLFIAYGFILARLFERLQIPVRSCQIGSLFLLAITFTDRPDSLAHVFGMMALYSWIRGREVRAEAPWVPRTGWLWLSSVAAILALATGIQIGAVYLVALWLAEVSLVFLRKRPFAWGPMLLTLLAPAALVGSLVELTPRLWAGFLEHAAQTPSFSGLRTPGFDELLKLLRTVPGLLATGLLLLILFGPRFNRSRETWGPLHTVLLAAIAAGLAICGAAMFLLTPNSVFFAVYLQPLVVAGGLGLVADPTPPTRPGQERLYVYCKWALVFMALVASVRAIGLSTWGVVCSIDTTYRKSMEEVRAELISLKPGQTVVCSSAYLYEASHHQRIRSVHSDWMGPCKREQLEADWQALHQLKPARLLLTQFDYYRRYEPLLSRLRTTPGEPRLRLANKAGVPSPDSVKASRRVVQHVAWAPVVISIDWPTNP